MAGKHTGPRDWVQNEQEWFAWFFATKGITGLPIRGRRHKPAAEAVIRAEYHRWNASTERTHARKEQHAHPVNPT